MGKGIFDDPPIVYENTRFQRAGFHDGHHNDLTSYEGYPNDENNAAWDQLLTGKYFVAMPQRHCIKFLMNRRIKSQWVLSEYPRKRTPGY